MASVKTDILNGHGEVVGFYWQSDGSGAPTHKTDIGPKDLRVMLNDDEKADLASSTNAIVKKAINAIQFDPEMAIDTTIPRFATLMNAMIADGIIDAARKAVLIQGLPI